MCRSSRLILQSLQSEQCSLNMFIEWLKYLKLANVKCAMVLQLNFDLETLSFWSARGVREE